MGIALVGSGKQPSPRLNDIPAMLRSAASRMEASIDEIPETFVWVTQYSDGSISVGAFGDGPNKFEMVGILTLAARLYTPGNTEAFRS